MVRARPGACHQPNMVHERRRFLRRNAGIMCLWLGILFWILSFMAYPYRSMGVGPQYLRRGVADLSAGSAITCLALLAIAGLLACWKDENRHGRERLHWESRCCSSERLP